MVEHEPEEGEQVGATVELLLLVELVLLELVELLLAAANLFWAGNIVLGRSLAGQVPRGTTGQEDHDVTMDPTDRLGSEPHQFRSPVRQQSKGHGDVVGADLLDAEVGREERG